MYARQCIIVIVVVDFAVVVLSIIICTILGGTCCRHCCAHTKLGSPEGLQRTAGLVLHMVSAPRARGCKPLGPLSLLLLVGAPAVLLFIGRSVSASGHGRDDILTRPTQVLLHLDACNKSGGAARQPITLITHLTLDRLAAVVQSLESWSGPASIAVYINATRGSATAAKTEMAVVEAIRPVADGISELDILAMYRSGPIGLNAGGETIDYPVNALRNLAATAVRTDLIFLVDADFVPSAHLLADLKANETMLEYLHTSRTALVVPAFEVLRGWALPKHFDELVALMSTEEPKANGFHMSSFPLGHAQTDYRRWLSATMPYAVGYVEQYEPYIIASRKWLPRYDERFQGYGLNKASHLYMVAASGAEFLVLPRHFIAAAEVAGLTGGPT